MINDDLTKIIANAYIKLLKEEEEKKTSEGVTDGWFDHSDTFQTSKRGTPIKFQTTKAAGSVDTLEGPVAYEAGHHIVTGPKGERYPVSPDKFKTQQTVFDLIKIGLRTETKTKEITKEFDTLLTQMNLIKSNRIVEAICYGQTIKLGEEIDGKAGNSKVVSTTEGKETINFSNITFAVPKEAQINGADKIKEYTSSNADALRKVNTYLLLNAQIGSQAGKGVGLGSIDFTGAPYEQEEMTSRIKLIDNNK